MLAISVRLARRGTASTQRADDNGDGSVDSGGGGGAEAHSSVWIQSPSELFAEGALRFKDPDLEARWLMESEKRALAIGARTVLFLSALFILDLCRDVIQHKGSLECKRPGELPAWFGELSAILATSAASAVACTSPRASLYYSILFFYSIYVLFASLPPLRITCTELFKNPECERKRPWAVHAVDCSVLGETSQQLIVSCILLLPWLIPRYKDMTWVWVWIFPFYGGVTLLSRSLSAYNYFTRAHFVVSLVTLSLTASLATWKKKLLESSHRHQFYYDLQQQKDTEKLFNIFQFMMPAHVITRMLRGEPIADQIDRVSILFIVITDFEQFASKCTPQELLEFLNDKFSRMDELCDANGVTKVETVGEEYVACVGVVPEDVEEERKGDHSTCVGRLLTVAENIFQTQDSTLRYKMGIHTGPIVAGVIGQKLPRFRLFGDTINTAARMMQKSLPGRLQFGQETLKYVPNLFAVTERGEVEMKGKGKFKVWLFPADAKAAGAPTEATPQQPSLATEKLRQKVRGIGKRNSLIQELLGSKIVQSPEPTPTDEQQPEIGPSDKAEDENAESNEAVTSKSHISGSFDDVVKEVSLEVLQRRFTPEMEADWMRTFHRDSICQGLAARLDRQALALSTFCAVEVAYMLESKSWEKPHEMVAGEYRLPIYMGCQLACFAIIMAWRAVAHRDWVLQNLMTVQVWMLLCFCLAGILLFVSYDMLTSEKDEFTDFYDHEHSQQTHKAPFDQSWFSVFILAFYFLTTENSYRFWPSLVFIGLSIFLVSCVDIAPDGSCRTFHGFGTVFFSWEGRLLIVANAIVSTFLARQAELSSRARYRAVQATAVTGKRIDGILESLMPPLLLAQLREGSVGPRGSIAQSHLFRAATIAQSDLCGFTKLASTRTPLEVVEFVSQLFGRFDKLTDTHDVYKVETIGDAYIAGQAEPPLTRKNEPVSVILFGLDMIRETALWAANLGVKVACRVGVHHGECVGGMVGNDMHRYHLFGHFMTVLDTLEATSEEGVAQVSSACKAAVERQLKQERRTAKEAIGSFEQREEPHLKTSKGEIHEYSDVGGNTFLVRLTDGSSDGGQ